MTDVYHLHRALLVLVVALALGWALPAPATGVTPDGRGEVQRTTTASYVTGTVAHTNRRRVAHERRQVRVHRCLTRMARKQARRMAAQERMFHQEMGAVLRRCDLSRVGENVAYGYPTGKSVVKAWMHSPGHRRNILDGRFRLIGVGAARSDDGVWYAAQVFGRG
ncbi:CAP domain-containing protein [Nocardioides sambongensis]|uniref:CAP domain-containing protein n=1 Tax=Nocardioides sambongensis TaxID=2589074 RepID=UPI00112C0A8D|nr:CAP domain-containing protein [Nocardioides sambongensis]